MQAAQAQPFNLLLDPLPEDYKGWLIRTDYRIGMQISLCLGDAELSQNERIAQSVYLLFGEGTPPLDVALEGLEWFLNGGQPRRDDIPPVAGPQRFWFDYDAARTSASFKKSFGIDLHRVKMHWFEFLSLLDCVDEDSSLSHAIQTRGTDTSTMKGKQRHDVERIKRLLTPPVTYTQEEQEAIDNFFSQME